MPRATQSKAAAIIDFFRKEDLPTATLVMDLCKSALGERLQKSAKARAKQQEPPPAPASAAAPVARKKAKKAKVKRQKRQPAAPPALPLQAADEGAYETASGVESEAGDLVTQ